MRPHSDTINLSMSSVGMLQELKDHFVGVATYSDMTALLT